MGPPALQRLRFCWQMGQVDFWASHLSRHVLWNWCLQVIFRRQAPASKSSRQIRHLWQTLGIVRSAMQLTAHRNACADNKAPPNSDDSLFSRLRKWSSMRACAPLIVTVFLIAVMCGGVGLMLSQLYTSIFLR